ncbi:hypothetical protein FACS1894111_06010 [Clostridia bacterium]|nr:hypothetical protein FACS1894111_06010 [Clostridia bacterium]
MESEKFVTIGDSYYLFLKGLEAENIRLREKYRKTIKFVIEKEKPPCKQSQCFYEKNKDFCKDCETEHDSKNSDECIDCFEEYIDDFY